MESLSRLTSAADSDGNILLRTKDALDKVTICGYNENTNVLRKAYLWIKLR